MHFRLPILLALAVVLVASAAAADPVAECHRLAGNPNDPGHVGAGVEFGAISSAAAIVACLEAVEANPKAGRLAYQLGRAYDAGKNFSAAENAYLRATDLGFTLAKRNLGYLYQDGAGGAPDAAKAEKWFRGAAKDGDAESMNQLAWMWVVAGEKLKEAADFSNRSVTAVPEDPEYHDTFGWVDFKLGRYEDAAAELEHAIRIAPSDASFHAHLGWIYEALGRDDEARTEWQRALDLPAPDPLADPNLRPQGDGEPAEADDLGQSSGGRLTQRHAVQMPHSRPTGTQIALILRSAGSVQSSNLVDFPHHVHKSPAPICAYMTEGPMPSALKQPCFGNIILTAAAATMMLCPTFAMADNTISEVSARPDIFDALDAAQSGSLSGYRIKKGPVRRASNLFKVPSVTCLGKSTQGIAVGIGNETAKGEPTVLGSVFVTCFKGAPFFKIKAKVGAQFQSSLLVLAGDKVKVLVTQSPTTETAEVTDVTSGAVVKAAAPPKSDSRVTFGAFPLFVGKDELGVPNFGSVTFTNNKINAKTLAAKLAAPINRNKGTTVQIATGRIARGAFKITFHHV